MLNSIAFVLLFITMLTAWRSGLWHQPIALALSWVCIGAYVVSQPIPALMIYMATATNPVAIVAAAWGAGQSKARPHFPVIFAVGAVIATLIAMIADRFGVFGQCMACFWVLCALVGGAGLYRSDAPAITRSVLILLIGALPCEAGGWLAWAFKFDLGFAFSRMITNLSLLIILGIQVSEGVTWPRWAILQSFRLARRRSRTGADATEEPTNPQSRR